MTKVAAPEVKARLDELLEAVDHGEEVVITTDKGTQYRVIAEPPGPVPGRRGYGALKGKTWMADDFDAPLEDFKDYM